MSTLAAAADSMQGKLHGADHPFNGVSTDTRTLQKGELFVALQGPNFDGCNYVTNNGRRLQACTWRSRCRLAAAVVTGGGGHYGQ